MPQTANIDRPRMHKASIFFAISALVVGLPLTVHAADLPTAPFLPLALAQKAANAALTKCVADGHRVSVAIVGRDGSTQTLIKADGAGPHTVGSSTGKAFTAASMGRDTMGLAAFMKDKPELDGLRDMDARLVILAGGVPIKIDGVLVGGIGVGGAPSGALDADCAQTGVAAIGGQ